MRIKREFKKNPPAKNDNFYKTKVFFEGISWFFSFLTKKKAKGEISDIISEKTVCKKTTIFTKRNGFFAGYIVFF